MKVYYDCYPCFLNQVLSLIKLTGLDEEQAEQMMDYAVSLLAQMNGETTTQHLVRWSYDYLQENFFPGGEADFDPYREIKAFSNRTVLQGLDGVESMIQQAEDPLRTAVRAAAAGNIIDFGAKTAETIDIDRELAEIPRLTFAVEEIDPFRERLKGARRVLYIGDNAGEVVLDRILLEEIRRENPGAEVVFAHREKPIINDALASDAAQAGLPDSVRVISSGSVYPGTLLGETSREFQEFFRGADLIISKGQGNYETLCSQDHPGLFFILRVKCARVSRATGAAVGKLILESARKIP